MQHFPLTNKLHTDVLEERYGPIHAVVLRHDAEIREAHLSDATDISRTYAVTLFNNEVSADIAMIDATIRNGAPIGKAFRTQGYDIRKNVIDVYVLDIPPWLRDAFQVTGTKAKVRLSEFYARKNDRNPEIYGIVAEVYSPEFRLPEINEVDRAQLSAVTCTLEVEGITKQTVWERVGKGNDWSDLRAKFAKAKSSSKPLIDEYRQQILCCIVARQQ